MIKRLFIAAGIGLALSGGALAEDAAKAGAKAQGSVTGDTTARAIAQCEQLSGVQKTNCLQQARDAADRSAMGGTSSSASGRVGSPASQPQGAAPGAGAPKAY
jgi:hypothetical protein